MRRTFTIETTPILAHMHGTLELVLILLLAAVAVVALFRVLALPALLGYLLVGVLIGPKALGLVSDSDETRYLGEFGVVFLMFSIGLEFSLPKLLTMRRLVFGLGAAQVAVSASLVLLTGLLAGIDWRAALVLGGVAAMSSTAILAKMLSERLELNSPHGRQIVGILLFQDLAVVPLLILIPALTQAAETVLPALGLAMIKAALVLLILLYFGQRLMRPWFTLVARQKSSELFALNVLLITLGLAWVTERAGLSMALGAFLAGMLISETEYRYQVEQDIKPFRDVLLGLFFVTVGMLLDPSAVVTYWYWIVVLLPLILVSKTVIIVGLGRLFGADTSVSLRSGLALAGAGGVGLVLLALASRHGVVDNVSMQIALATLILSMLLSPFIIEYSEHMVRRFSAAEWMNRAMALHSIAVQTMSAERHVIICGYGRSGQNLARFLDREEISFIALDFDPQRVREAAAAGESVVFGDAARREVLVAAGLMRADALVVSYADTASALRILSLVQDMRPGLPVVVRTIDDADIDQLKRAGAAEVVAEILEGSLMLATQALMLLGVPLNRVLRRIRETREQRYDLFRGFYYGVSDEADESGERMQLRLHSVLIVTGAVAVGKTLGELDLTRFDVEVTAIRQRNVRNQNPEPETLVQEGDVLVLRGMQESLSLAEMFLLKG